MEQTNTNAALQAAREQVVAKGKVSGTNCYVAKAEGSLITDVEGNEYIDFGGGIAVMNVGHSHPRVVKAIKDQADQFTHTCFMVAPYGSAVKLAEKLCEIVPGDFKKAAFFANSGAEAVENAIKIARYYTKKTGVIAFENGFHGRTLLGMSLTSKVNPYKKGFGPFAPEVYRMPFAYCYRCSFNLKYPSCNVACADHLEEFFINHVSVDQTAAIIVEPVQGEGGFIVPPKEYFTKLRSICDANDILLIADEIQTGIGRTGTMFAMEHFGISADITTVAKSLAAGMPLSAVVGKKEIMDAVHPGGIGGTYGANPIACEAALAVLDLFEEEDLLEKAVLLGRTLESRLHQFKDNYDIIGDVRGIGPMIAMELVTDRENKTPAPEAAKTLVKYAYDSGLILLSCGTFGNVIRLLMPLNIPEDVLNKGLNIIEKGLQKIQG
jgi:4-aminobutyrate aminotransferase/(S)-3-amino-2-methylpropionate transaminase